MKNFDETTYGERVAGVYDNWYGGADEATLDLLQALAAGGRVLELGIGTGRVALPLQRRRVDVTGIEISEAMIAQLRAKPGGPEIPVVHGSFAALTLKDRFDLVYVVFNTFFMLLTQEEQVHCFRSVAEHLTERGVFLLEVFMPDFTMFDRQQAVRAIEVREEGIRLSASRHNPVAQEVVDQTVVLSEAGVRLYPLRLRYAWPSELDLMARLAGLSLRHRWGSWRRDEFTAQSEKHISVYGWSQQSPPEAP